MKHPVYAPDKLTDGELLRYRRDLESAIAELPPASGTVDGLRAKLDGVTAEQDSRRRQRGSHKPPEGGCTAGELPSG